MVVSSHELHNLYVRLHDLSRDYKHGLPPKQLLRPPEMDNFQDPQVSLLRMIQECLEY